MEVGGWVQVSPVFFLKTSQNCSKPVLIFWSSIQCVFCLYTLLKVVNDYDLNVLSMSVMGFQKRRSLDGVDGWGELHPSVFWIFGKCLTLQIPLGLGIYPQ